MSVSEAVWAAAGSCQFELEHVRRNLMVVGAPHLVAGASNAGGGGKKK